jgi:UV excision repair protein RAD23
MKLILKTLKQVPHEVEFESDSITIKELKDLTEKKHNIQADTIKLVFNGVVLKDESSIASYNITDGNVLVMMVTKTKAHNKPVVEEPKEIKSTTTTTTNTSNINTGISNNQPLNNQTTVPLNNNLNTGGVKTSTQPQTQTQPNYTNEINSLVEMGFPKDYSETAIKAARGNVTLAIEFLYNGIPENLPLENNVPQNNQTVTNPNSNVGESSQGENQPTSSLEAVRRIAAIIKVMCANDPSSLQNIILTLQQTRPELIELIKQHEAEFKQILQSPVTEEDLSAFSQFNNEIGLNQGSGSGSGVGGRQRGNNQNVITLSKPEFDAIQRLKEFGFSEMDAAQAYFACDKNEELAINFLFEMKAQEGGSFDSKFIFSNLI